jgi:hypothetical protein
MSKFFQDSSKFIPCATSIQENRNGLAGGNTGFCRYLAWTESIG